MASASPTVSVEGSTPSSSAARRIAERMRWISVGRVSASHNSVMYPWPVTPMKRANTSLSGGDRRSNRGQRSPNSSSFSVSSSCSRRRSNSTSRARPSGDSILLSAACMSLSLNTSSLEPRGGTRQPRPDAPTLPPAADPRSDQRLHGGRPRLLPQPSEKPDYKKFASVIALLHGRFYKGGTQSEGRAV